VTRPLTALLRTIARHEGVLRQLASAPVKCRETVREYEEEVDALKMAIGLFAVEDVVHPVADRG